MVQPINGVSPMSVRESYGTTPNEVHTKFADNLKQAIQGVNDAKVHSDNMTTALARGEVEDLHNVMISSQKASIMMTTATEMQSKVIDAYKEVMRMQV